MRPWEKLVGRTDHALLTPCGPGRALNRGGEEVPKHLLWPDGSAVLCAKEEEALTEQQGRAAESFFLLHLGDDSLLPGT